VISLAGITDLVAYDKVGNSCSEAVPQLMGGEPAQWPEHYRQGNPIDLLPASVPLVLVHGTDDAIVPIAQSETFVQRAQAAGSAARLVSVRGGGHFDMVYPQSVAWEAVIDLLKGEVGRSL
jgi:dipeptidyl aminopeptidase/acylaminoacyl peptidase